MFHLQSYTLIIIGLKIKIRKLLMNKLIFKKTIQMFLICILHCTYVKIGHILC
jgi:hypothetical protein